MLIVIALKYAFFVLIAIALDAIFDAIEYTYSIADQILFFLKLAFSTKYEQQLQNENAIVKTLKFIPRFFLLLLELTFSLLGFNSKNYHDLNQELKKSCTLEHSVRQNMALYVIWIPESGDDALNNTNIGSFRYYNHLLEVKNIQKGSAVVAGVNAGGDIINVLDWFNRTYPESEICSTHIQFIKYSLTQYSTKLSQNPEPVTFIFNIPSTDESHSENSAQSITRSKIFFADKDLTFRTLKNFYPDDINTYLTKFPRFAIRQETYDMTNEVLRYRMNAFYTNPCSIVSFDLDTNPWYRNCQARAIISAIKKESFLFRLRSWGATESTVNTALIP